MEGRTPSVEIEDYMSELTLHDHMDVVYDILNQCPDEGTTYTIHLEGNIASGKTSFLNLLRSLDKNKDIAYFPEPVSKWQNVGGENVLKNAYENPDDHLFKFQALAINDMMRHHAKKVDKKIKIIERSLSTIRWCFLPKLYTDGHFSSSEYTINKQVCDFYLDEFPNMVKPDLIVYLMSSPKKSHQRVMSRARPGEEKITLEYLQGLHDLHQSFISEQRKTSKIIVIDADKWLTFE